MNQLKKVLALLLALSIILGVTPSLAADIVNQGTCGKNGDNLTWTIDSNKTLTISGEGEMADYDYKCDMPPWHGKNFTKVIITYGVTTIGDWAFRDCTGLLDVTIENSVTKIGDYAFADCSGIVNITVPDSVSEMGEGAFTYCYNLKSFVIPDGVTEISDFLLDTCVNLETVSIPSSVKTIGERAFIRCTALTDVYYDGSKDDWKMIDIGDYNQDLLNATLHCSKELPTSEPPVTDDPTTEPPITEDPATTNPVETDDPTTEPPTDEPTVDPTDEPEVIIGDVNGNDGLDAGDATMILRQVVGSGNLTDEQKALADVNKNGMVDAGDATMVLRIVVGAA